MRIIERTNPINKSVLFVVQDESYGHVMAAQMGGQGLLQNSPYQKKFVDVRQFATLEEAKTFVYNYQNSLGVGERIVG